MSSADLEQLRRMLRAQVDMSLAQHQEINRLKADLHQTRARLALYSKLPGDMRRLDQASRVLQEAIQRGYDHMLEIGAAEDAIAYSPK